MPLGLSDHVSLAALASGWALVGPARAGSTPPALGESVRAWLLARSRQMAKFSIFL
jgi:hypothetical protein